MARRDRARKQEAERASPASEGSRGRLRLGRAPGPWDRAKKGGTAPQGCEVSRAAAVTGG